MPPSDDLGQLKTLDWEQLQVLASRFEAARHNDEAIDWDKYLPPAEDPLRKPVLYELIKIDLEVSWRRGRSVRLESYLERLPELGTSQELPARLIYEEYRARQQFGDKPSLTVYQSRFPDQFAELQRLIAEQPVTARPAPAPPAPVPPPGVGTDTGPPQASQTIAGFQLIRWLGGGSFADVWLAKAPGGVDVAFKLIKQPMDREEAQNELKALELIKGLHHQFLLPLHSFGLANDRLYMVTSLADGTLRDRMKQCRKAGAAGIPLDELIVYLKESAEALDFLHEHKVLHRDIKPENLLVKGKHANVADMGLAKALHSQRFSVTGGGGGAGTPAYMAPEVWQSKVSKHSDQYSLAATYAELRVGRRAFAGQSMAEVMYAHLHGEPDLDNLSEAERQVLLKALAKNPDERYPSCQEFARQLERAVLPELRQARPDLFPPAELPPTAPGSFVIGRPGSSDSVPTVPGSGGQTWRPPDEPPTLPKLLKWSAAAALALLAVAAIIWTRNRSTPSPPARRPVTLARPADQSLKAGVPRPVPVFITRDGFDGPVELTFSGLPAGVFVIAPPPAEANGVSALSTDSRSSEHTVTLGGGETNVQLHLLALPDAPAANVAVKVRARAEGHEAEEATFDLNVDPSGHRLPAGWHKGDQAQLLYVPADGRAYYDRIEVVRATVPVPFVLVCPDARKQKAGAPKVPTYYIMEDKVWAGLFRAFAAEQLASTAAGLLQGESWGKAAWVLNDARFWANAAWERSAINRADDNPAVAVLAHQAYRCAAWLGGDLPTPTQWDTAAGRWHVPARQGPFEGSWADLTKPQKALIGVDRETPMGRAKMTIDVSPYGCRHLAGNGLEWTGKLLDREEAVAQLGSGKREQVVMRGCRYTDLEPLFFDRIDKAAGPGHLFSNFTDDEIGFRVVIDP